MSVCVHKMLKAGETEVIRNEMESRERAGCEDSDGE